MASSLDSSDLINIIAATLELLYAPQGQSSFYYSFIFGLPHVKVFFMKNGVSLVPAVMIFLLCSVPAFAFEGPLQVKNQFPIFLPINQPYLEQASAENSFSLSLSHSSVFVIEGSAHWTAHTSIWN
jgi:hypothetical protein